MKSNCGFCGGEVKTSTTTSSTTSGVYLKPGVYINAGKYRGCGNCGEISPVCQNCLEKILCLSCSRSEKIEECLS
jgi:hypothetical protein